MRLVQREDLTVSRGSAFSTSSCPSVSSSDASFRSNASLGNPAIPRALLSRAGAVAAYDKHTPTLRVKRTFAKHTERNTT